VRLCQSSAKVRVELAGQPRSLALETQSIPGKTGAPCGIRTHGPRIRNSLTDYPPVSTLSNPVVISRGSQSTELYIVRHCSPPSWSRWWSEFCARVSNGVTNSISSGAARIARNGFGGTNRWRGWARRHQCGRGSCAGGGRRLHGLLPERLASTAKPNIEPLGFNRKFHRTTNLSDLG
jgi:hypothetical protein